MKRSWTAICLCLLLVSIAGSQDNGLNIITPPEHRRAADQTFLTFPEWYLVYSPAEYAGFSKDQPPNEFPFVGHLKQFWASYAAVADEANKLETTNYGYHVMINVIGVSTSMEYGFKSAYETLVGRVSLATRGDQMTAEELLAANVAQDYVDFLEAEPWYKYDFAARLKELWTTTGLWGPDPLRKWERKYLLTTEYAAKAIYGWLIGKATAAGYEAPKQTTAVVVANGSNRLFGDLGLEVLDHAGGRGYSIVLLPRYQAFTDKAVELAANGTEFIEIAGNRGDILVSLLTPAGWEFNDGTARILIAQPILTQPNQKRYLISVPVARLSGLLRELAGPEIVIEHIYDY